MRNFLTLFLYFTGANAFVINNNLQKSPNIIRNVHLEDTYSQTYNPTQEYTSGFYQKNEDFQKYDIKPSPSEIKFDKNSRYPQDHPILIQGNTLKTWTYKSYNTERVQVNIGSSGRPVNADIELWNGPSNTPFKMKVYLENGEENPFNAIVETPRGPNTLSVKNSGELEFPITAELSDMNINMPTTDSMSKLQNIQGGALKTYTFDGYVDSVQVFIKTDGRPISSRIELLQGPNNNKQVIDVYSEDGFTRPFFCIIKTPGPGCVVRILNTATLEFPMYGSASTRSTNYLYNDPIMN